MAEYIDRDELIKGRVENDPVRIAALCEPAADVVPRCVYDQTVWERDLAIHQLKYDYGVGFGEKKREDIITVKHGKWEQQDFFDEDANVYVCSVCNEPWTLNAGNPKENNMNYCPCCGAKMDS